MTTPSKEAELVRKAAEEISNLWRKGKFRKSGGVVNGMMPIIMSACRLVCKGKEDEKGWVRQAEAAEWNDANHYVRVSPSLQRQGRRMPCHPVKSPAIPSKEAIAQELTDKFRKAWSRTETYQAAISAIDKATKSAETEIQRLNEIILEYRSIILPESRAAQQVEWSDDLSVKPHKIVAQPQECKIEAGSSRICERGKKGCEVRHTPQPQKWAIQPALRFLDGRLPFKISEGLKFVGYALDETEARAIIAAHNDTLK